MDTVVPFSGLTSLGLDAVGGKALNLGVLQRAGFPVPDGFVITTGAYRAVVGDRLDDLAVEFADPGAASRTAARAGIARDRVRAADVPDGLLADVLEAYRRLGTDLPVAVRSSATAEDLAGASFAGQQDTYLNVVGEAALETAVRDCWASLWTERAVSYRTSNGIDHRTVALAVVVQVMVDAVVAGVMFTANPITGTRGETVVDASGGLGEAVVSGSVNPDHFVVDIDRRRVVSRRIGDKRVRVTSRVGGGTDSTEVFDAGDTACLTDAQVLALAALGRRVQNHYGAPQDTEWALDAAGKLWLTQARPITTLYPLPRGRPAPGPGSSSAPRSPRD